MNTTLDSRASVDIALARATSGSPGPDFLCVGAQKGGTGWLYEQLRTHPDFWMPPVKELHYFDRARGSEPQISLFHRLLGNKRSRRSRLDRRRNATRRRNARDERDVRFLDAMEDLYRRPEIDMEGYAHLFRLKESLISGDITPAYSILQDEIIERIASQFPNAKVIFLARDPVERAWSQLSMRVRHGTIDSFDTNDLEEVTRQLLRTDVLVRSHPSKIVQRWRRHVSPDKFRTYFFDDLKRDPAGLRRAIIDFLGGDPAKGSPEVKPEHNAKMGKAKLPLNDSARAHVARFFEKELKACAAELGGRATEWPARYGF